ncbi:DNA polymerase X family/PHP domain-containing protein [Burkholderia pseudomallei]|nr:DNA polymerase X family/PHP domain-containing protein [Burkholderia pseudomallei]CAJ7762687.1 DNA polymerase X family/PHP domain-containing protein [Burkholderia pseudomallei]VCH20904.1 DNA polymerase X family/PHP domain-containing protein [Burkholderia pseudomallei]VCH55088.1 DNA polymerase X family/PHP domain-containing protein [Burkholderia pseudomallei]
MPIHNADFAAVFAEIADLLEIQGANPFRVRAYRNAARTIGGLGRDIGALIAAGRSLDDIPTIGADLAGKLREIATTGTCALQRQLRGALPAAIVELLGVPGLGAKRVRALHDALGVETLEQLKTAAEHGKIRGLPGFGEKTEAHIAEAIGARLRRKSQRFLLSFATQYLTPLLTYLRETPGVSEAVAAGSFRRRRESVGDLDIVVTSGDPAKVSARFVEYGEVARVLASGDTRSSVVLRCGIQADLRVVSPAALGAALVYFTGSKAHNIAMRRIAQARDLKINEYGVFDGERRIAGATEESVYASIGLAWVPPELRENRGEIEAAREGRLPALVERKHLRGDLHAHTNATDGRDSLRDMALEARKRGLDYLAITDHARGLGVAHGLDAERLARQIDEIDRLNETLDGIVLLKGIEVDILEDGSLDLPDGVLARLDLVVGAVHGHFDLSRAAQTERVLRAMDHPYFSILAHPSGRLLGERDACDIDLARVIEHARARGCHLELNAQPQRLDLADVWCRHAAEAGVLVSIDSDAHRREDLGHLGIGVDQARRGWLTKAQVLNTRTLAQLRPLLARTMGGGAMSVSASEPAPVPAPVSASKSASTSTSTSTSTSASTGASRKRSSGKRDTAGSAEGGARRTKKTRRPSPAPHPRERAAGHRGGARRRHSFRCAESAYRCRCRMLDSAPMSYWRKLFVIVLLVLSLPVQTLAAVSMNCDPAPADDGGAPAHAWLQASAENGHGMHDAAAADDGHRHDGRGGAHHDHAHACSTCLSCCVGAGLPAASVAAASFDAARTRLFLPRDTRAVSFLTGGIERPPRTSLV